MNLPPILLCSCVTMSKSSKTTLETGEGRKGGQQQEEDIFCEKCNFVFQGESEFKSHQCQQNSPSTMDAGNNKSVISLENKKAKQPNVKVIKLVPI